MAERALRWRWSAAVLAAAAGAVGLVSGSGAASRTAEQLPGAVAPGPNACLPGSGSRNWCGDGGPATRAKLAGPGDVATAADGTLFIADTASNVIRRVGTDGVIATVAGDGAPPRRLPRDVEPAARPFFNRPTGVAVAPDGSVLVADTGNNAIRRITLDGRVVTVMGGPRRVLAKLDHPEDVLALPTGDVLVADTRGNRVLRLTTAGAVVRVAGTGEFGEPADGARATDAPLELPVQLAVIPGDQLLIADRGTGTAYLVGPSGFIFAVQHVRDELDGVVWTPDLGVVLSRSLIAGRERNTSSEIVRADPSGGRPIRIAGIGRDGFTGNSGRATRVALSLPRQLAVAPDGALLIAEAGSDRIRRLGADGRITTLAGSGRPRSVASVVPRRKGSGAQPGGAGCFGRQAQFQVFNFLPGDRETLVAGARQLAVRVQTSVKARVSIALKWRKDVVRRRVLEEVSNARVSTLVKLRAQLSKARKYIVEMTGTSLANPGVKRCDRRRVLVR